MLERARVVIVGGGSLGVSLLYHLSKEGWCDTLLIEKGELTSGSTWHAAGLVPNFNGNMTVSKIHQASSRARVMGIDYDFISKSEAKELCPLMSFDDARIIMSTPSDGHVDPTSVVMPLSQGARANGATISRFNRVIDINLLPSGEWEVITEKGVCIAEHVVNAAGCFAPEVGAMVGVKLRTSISGN